MSDEMKRDGAMRIFEALSSVDEELLERSEAEKRVIPFWRYSKVMAACICLVVLGAATFATTKISSDNATSSDCAAPMEEMAAADAAMDANMAAAEEPEMDMEAAVEEEPAAWEGQYSAETESNSTLSGSSDTTDGASAYDEVGAQIVDLESDKQVDDDEMLMDWGLIENAPISADEATLRNTELGAYVPTAIPAGYTYSDGSQYQDAGEVVGISLSWCKGMDTIMIGVGRYTEEEDADRIVDISKPETYNVHLYEIPYSETVPDEVSATFHNPIFRASDMSLEVIEARMKSRQEAGDTDTPRGSFAVLYDSGVLVSFNVRGETEEIWEMYLSIDAE